MAGISARWGWLAALALLLAGRMAHAQDGVLDADFAGGGERALSYVPQFTDRDDRAVAVLRDSQGRLLVLTSRVRDLVPETGRDLDLLLYRLTAAGALDTSFGSGRGYVLREFAWSDMRTAILDRQGRILLVGTVVTQQNGGLSSLTLARLLADGSRDPGFTGGTGAVGQFSFSIGSELGNRATAVTLLPNDDLVLAGHLVTTPGNVDMFAMRLAAADGAPAPGWGNGNGLQTLDLQTPGALAADRPLAISALADGRLLLMGQSCAEVTGCRPAAVRLTGIGAPDPSYCASTACRNSSVTGTVAGARIVRDVAVPGYSVQALDVRSALADGDGRALLAASSTVSAGPTPAPAVVLRLAADGSNDDGFASSGVQVLALPDAEVQPATLLLDGQSRLLVGGSTARAGLRQALLGRLLANGQPDTGFGRGAALVEYLPSPAGADRVLKSLLIDGSRVLALGDRNGTSSRDAFLLRIGPALFANGFE